MIDLMNFIVMVLNICVILSCCVAKIPQIQKIIEHQSAKGISLLSLYLEVIRYSVMWCYNYCYGYSLLSYLEYPILLAQQLTLIFLALKYNSMLGMTSYLWALALASIICVFLSGTLTRTLLLFLMSLCTPLGAFSKVTQLVKIIQTKNSRNISLMSWFFTAFTSFSRICTTLIESGDLMLLVNSITSLVTSSSVFMAAWYYKIYESKKTT